MNSETGDKISKPEDYICPTTIHNSTTAQTSDWGKYIWYEPCYCDDDKQYSGLLGGD